MIFRKIWHVATRIGMTLLLFIILMKIGIHPEKKEVKKLKIDGVGMVSINDEIDSLDVSPFADLVANWAAEIPFAFMALQGEPELSFDLK